MTDDGSRELFDRLKREGWPVVQAWVDDQEAETNHLEFKNKENAERSEIAPADLTEIAKSVSAFANTGGGLLVIGVDAGGGTKRGAGFDRVRRISPISGVEAFGGGLERRIKNLCD